MDEKIIEMTNNKELATKRVEKWIGNYSRIEISKILKISRSTLYNRLECSNWKFEEIKLINKHFPF